MREVERVFRAMNTDVQVVIVAADEVRRAEAAIAQIEALFARVEAALSRFRPDSELSCLNRHRGSPFPASPLLWTVVSDALGAARATGGLFDPTILGALVAAGYDRSFELVPRDAPSPFTVPLTDSPNWEAIVLDERERTIALPPSAGLDLGGIAKGWSVDRAVALLAEFPGFGVDAGGDLYCRGGQVNGEPWTVGVQDPLNPARDLLTIKVDGLGVATSTSARRAWRRSGEKLHHLIDPRTGRPSASDVISATVIAPTVARAEVLAKVALLLGSHDGERFLADAPDAEGVLVLEDGRQVRSARFREVVGAT